MQQVPTEPAKDTEAGQRRRLYRVHEVATELDVSKWTVYRAIKAGDMGAMRIGTGRGTLRVPEEALEKYRTRSKAAAVTTDHQAA